MHAIMLTGHREVSNPNAAYRKMCDLIGLAGIAYKRQVICIAGGALGADTLWAGAADLMEAGLKIYVPEGYFEYYKIFEKEPYLKDFYATKTIVYTSPLPENGKYDWRANFVRNDAMIDVASSHVVCSDMTPAELLDQPRGGTAACVKSMKKKGVTNVWHINPAKETIEYVSLV